MILTLALPLWLTCAGPVESPARRCRDADPSFLSTRRIWKCKACKNQFSVKVGTIFEDSPSARKWLLALWLIANCKNGISSYELARALGVTQKTAWFMNHRIRLAMQASRSSSWAGKSRSTRPSSAASSHSCTRASESEVTGSGMRQDRRHGASGAARRDGHSASSAVVPNVRKRSP